MYESVLDTDREFTANVRKQKLQYFGHIIRAQNLCTHIFGQYHRLDQQDSDGVHNSSTRQEELEKELTHNSCVIPKSQTFNNENGMMTTMTTLALNLDNGVHCSMCTI